MEFLAVLLQKNGGLAVAQGNDKTNTTNGS